MDINEFIRNCDIVAAHLGLIRGPKIYYEDDYLKITKTSKSLEIKIDVFIDRIEFKSIYIDSNGTLVYNLNNYSKLGKHLKEITDKCKNIDLDVSLFGCIINGEFLDLWKSIKISPHKIKTFSKDVFYPCKKDVKNFIVNFNEYNSRSKLKSKYNKMFFLCKTIYKKTINKNNEKLKSLETNLNLYLMDVYQNDFTKLNEAAMLLRELNNANHA